MSDYSDMLTHALGRMRTVFGSSSYPIVEVQSAVDGKTYKVRDMPDKQRAADMLAQLRLRMNKLKIHVESKFPDKPQVKMLAKNFKAEPNRLLESTPDAEYTSYSVNKGEAVHFCLRQRGGNESENEKLVESDVMTFVAIHEMAHMITESVGHGPDFWNNFGWLLREAEAISVYTHRDFREHPVSYCGMKITDQPVYDASKDGGDISIGRVSK
jgi:hypothetical protein